MRLGVLVSFGFVVLLSSRLAAAEMMAPCARSTIYPGEVVRADMLTEAPFELDDETDVIKTRGELVGRIAKRTLFPGKPVHASFVEAPHTIANGSAVQLLYERPGISISASGQALQSARAGDPVRVRNIESGLVVTGVASRTGIVLVDR